MTKEKCLWTSESVLKLLAEAEQRPCLWGEKDPKYMNKHIKNAAFEEIGAAIGVSADDARDKLRNLRTNFMQIYKKIPKSGSGAVQQPKWEFYNAMLFMTGELTTAGNTDSLDAVEETMNDDGENSVQSESNQSTSTVTAAKIPCTAKTAKRQKQGENDLSSALSPLYEELAKSRQQINKTKGPNEKFATEIAAVLNNIRDENIVKRAKARIHLILADSMAESARRDLAESELFSSTPSPTAEPISQVSLPHHEMNQQSKDLFSFDNE